MPNRLANESSPYLLQHKNNPVDWFPWCGEALRLAKDNDQPIFLSIGYSACHWCHVMEHESFENDEIAEFLNKNFVSIKVDREERPDIDHIYMQAVMAVSGHGGWPLSAFLTPDQNFFYGGTYWPPVASRGMPGFLQVLESVFDAFQSKREQLEEQSSQITQALQQSLPKSNSNQSIINPTTIEQAVSGLSRSFDSTFGGFGSAPKFPHPMDLQLLVRILDDESVVPSVNRDDVLRMVTTTLDKMAYGGINDHLAGGFARYSVDAQWLVPHFEKMLYDNAQLASVYTDAFRVTGNMFYKRTAKLTLEYLLQYMLDDAGGFHSTEDADSEGVEGKFYVWDRSEILEILGEEVGERFCSLYGVTESGNFEGKNILNVTCKYTEFAERHQIEKSDLRAEMKQARERLLHARDQRIRPGKDDKILVSWNALAIEAFAKASIHLEEPAFLEAAQNSAHFILNSMRHDNGRLQHTWRHGTAKLDAYLDGYTYLINALVSLYEADFNELWIREAIEMTQLVVTHFHDEAGGFFFTADDHESLIVRTKDLQDSSVPSGNSMAALALLRLGRLCGKNEWVELSESTMQSAASLIERAPLAAGQMLVAIHFALQPNRQLVLAVNDLSSETDQLVQLIRKQLNTPLIVSTSESREAQNPFTTVVENKEPRQGQPALYVCTDYTCESPIVGVDEIQKHLTK